MLNLYNQFAIRVNLYQTIFMRFVISFLLTFGILFVFENQSIMIDTVHTEKSLCYDAEETELKVVEFMKSPLTKISFFIVEEEVNNFPQNTSLSNLFSPTIKEPPEHFSGL